MSDSDPTRDDDSPSLLDLGQEQIEVPAVLPVLPVRDVVVFPGVTVPLAIGRPRSLAALEYAGQGGFLIVATQRDPATEDPQLEDLYPVACVVRVLRVIDARRDGKQAIVVGAVRTRLIGPPVSDLPLRDDDAMMMRVHPMPDAAAEPERLEGMWKQVVALAHRVIDLHDDYPDEWKSFVSGIPSPGLLADVVGSTLPLAPEEKIALLEQADPRDRLERIARHLEREVTIAETQRALGKGSEGEEMDPERRKRLLRRRMRDIEAELGEDSGIREVEELREKLEAAELPDEAEAQADRELQRLAALPQHAPDRHLIRTYVEWMADLPWSKSTEDKLEIAEARRVLDADHHDLEKVKDRILEFLAVRKLAPETKSPILCFVGPPGVGKTSLGRSIASAMGRKFARASLGGVRDEAEIRGHRRTYVGAMPGRILQSLRRAGSNNPVFLLDEIDKIGADFRGDPSSALLEVLDPEQNHTFSDHYLEVTFDLSQVLFIATANWMDPVPAALKDRMEVIELPGYTHEDKLEIARRYLIPRQRAQNGVDGIDLTIPDESVAVLVASYTREAGVRNLEREIGSLCRKVARRAAEEELRGPVTVRPEDLGEMLGPVKFEPELAERAGRPGVAVGLAWTQAGGDILFVESTRMPGKGELRLTGSLGDVMRESAEAARSWLRGNGKELEVDPEVFASSDVHVHVPAGAVPKDGPSAGVAMVTSLASLLTGRPARHDVAMTGEITLRGKVLPVGGIKEKVLAAKRAGIAQVVLPERNRRDVDEIPGHLLEGLEIEFVDSIDRALACTLAPAAADVAP